MEWISVKDRLPDEDDTYLVYLNGYGMEVARFDFHKTKKFLLTDDYGYDYEIYVNFWMPLPDPPKVVKSCSTQWRCEHAAIGTLFLEE